jgi:hypothetical protein
MHLSIPDLLCVSVYVLAVLVGLLQVVKLIRQVGK